jgi:hypothetical protein
MHSAVLIEPITATDRCSIEPEKVSVHHIRLTLSQQRISANVWSFHAADQILSSWAARSQGALVCEFEIVYDDGQTVAGEYRFKGKATVRPLLMGFVRKAVMDMCEGSSKGALIRGLCNGPRGFLADYATDDL